MRGWELQIHDWRRPVLGVLGALDEAAGSKHLALELSMPPTFPHTEGFSWLHCPNTSSAADECVSDSAPLSDPVSE